MRVYVVHPGATFATADVYTGLVAGLHACGAQVYEGRIDTILSWYDMALRAGAATGVFDVAKLEQGAFNRQRMASAHVTQHILDVRPDVVLVVSGHNYHIRDVQIIRRAKIPIACLLTESPYFGELEQTLAGIYGAVFTNERVCLPGFRRITPHAWYLPHAFNPAVHEPGEVDPAKRCDAFFVGSWFEERLKLLQGPQWGGIGLVWKGHDLSETPAEVVENSEAVEWYRSATVSLNMHRTTTSAGTGAHIAQGAAESLNPRAYEIPASGGFMLCDDSRGELQEVFHGEAPTYRAGDPDDLTRQVRHWMWHPERARVATAMREAVQPHTWQARAAQVLEALCP